MRRNDDVSDDILKAPQIERSLIMALLADDAGTGYAKMLRQYLLLDDFTDERNRDVWSIILKTLDDNQEVNMINIHTKATALGVSFDVGRYIITGSNFFSDIEQQGRLLHELGQKRRISEKIDDIKFDLIDANYSTANIVSELDALIKETVQSQGTSFSSWATVHKNVLYTTEEVANGKMPPGVRTGFSLIDRKGGLERGELMLIAGRNSNGKTSFALCVALAAAMQGVPVAIFSLEMTNLRLGMRLQSLMSGVDGESIKRGDMTEKEWDRFIGTPSDLPLYFDNKRSNNIDEVVNGINAIVEQRGIQVVVIDYLQLLRSRERDKAQQIGNICQTLQTLSTKLDITIILLSQLRRNNGTDYFPKMEELKESGDIENSADSIYMVYRPERHSLDAKYPDMSEKWSEYSTRGTGLLICYKNRNGAMDGEQMLRFDARTTRFYEDTMIERDELADAPSTGFSEDDMPF